MTPAELKKAMRESKKELRKTLPAMRKAARERVGQVPAVQRERRRRRIRHTIAAVMVVLLLLLIRCDCGAGAPPVAKVEPAAPAVPEPKPKKKVTVLPVKKKGLEGDGTKTNRGNLGIGAPPSPTWIDEFQLQVAARSPRLAQCFTGIERPGALRWAASVNPQSGAVSDHELEPVGVLIDLSAEQRACVAKVLSSPVYKLTAPEKEALPNRVSLVIEF